MERRAATRLVGFARPPGHSMRSASGPGVNAPSRQEILLNSYFYSRTISQSYNPILIDAHKQQLRAPSLAQRSARRAAAAPRMRRLAYHSSPQ